jgi:hypothetical protein
MPKQSNHSGPTHVTKKAGGAKSGPVFGAGPGFGGTGCIPYSGYSSGGTAVRVGGGNMQAWRKDRQHPTGGPLQTERRQVKRKK